MSDKRKFDELAKEREAAGWSGRNKHYPPGPLGPRWECHDCGAVLYSESGSRKHENMRCHVVLRVDWYEDGYIEILAEAERKYPT